MTNEAENRWAKLLVRVAKATRDGKLQWSPDPEVAPDKEDFISSFNNVIFNIYRHSGNRSSSNKIMFRVTSPERNIIDVFSDDRLSKEILNEAGAECSSSYEYMNNLLSAVARKSSGADEILDKLIDDLGDL